MSVSRTPGRSLDQRRRVGGRSSAPSARRRSLLGQSVAQPQRPRRAACSSGSSSRRRSSAASAGRPTTRSPTRSPLAAGALAAATCSGPTSSAATSSRSCLQGLSVSPSRSLVSAVAIAGVIGTMAGIVAGYLGGWASAVIMRVTDMLFAIPAILLALAIVTALGPGWLNSALAIGVGYIPIFVRVVRGPVLALREAGYVRAGPGARLLAPRLLFRHILPNVAGHRRRADEPRARLVDPGRGEPQLPRPRAAAADGVARRDGQQLRQSRRDRMVDAGRARRSRSSSP